MHKVTEIAPKIVYVVFCFEEGPADDAYAIDVFDSVYLNKASPPYRILVVGKTRMVMFSFKEHLHEKEFTFYLCEGKTIDVLNIQLFVPWDKNSI